MAAMRRLLMASVPLLTSSRKKHLVAAVNGLFDDREDVFGMDLNLALLEHRHELRRN